VCVLVFLHLATDAMAIVVAIVVPTIPHILVGGCGHGGGDRKDANEFSLGKTR